MCFLDMNPLLFVQSNYNTVFSSGNSFIDCTQSRYKRQRAFSYPCYDVDIEQTLTFANNTIAK